MKCKISTSAIRYQMTLAGRSIVLKKSYPIVVEITEEEFKSLSKKKNVIAERVGEKIKKAVVKPIKANTEKAPIIDTEAFNEAPTSIEIPKKEVVETEKKEVTETEKKEVKTTIKEMMSSNKKDKKKGKNKGKK